MKNTLRIIALIPMTIIYTIVAGIIFHYSPNRTIDSKRIGYAKRCFVQSVKTGYSLLFCFNSLHYFFYTSFKG